jgi:ferredoxin/coenzyme F420-reducing hydrogenase delta subunit
MFQPDVGTIATSFPGRARERAHRRALARIGHLYQWLEVALDRLVSPSLNPLYHTGTIAVFSLAVATVSGVYLFLFYRVGTGAAHASVEAIVAQPFGVGSLMRSLHRYSSDAAIVAALLHGLKMLLNDRFWGARWIGWVTGLALVGLVWFTGATGYWLVWDAQALVLSVTTAKLLDVLPFFGEPIVQTFVANDRIQNFLFFIVLFIHVTVPLGLGALYWLHVMRLARARFMPPRVVLWVTGLALVVASLLRPALSGPPADPSVVPSAVPIDWFYFPYFPLTTLDPRTGWAIVAGTGLVALLVPWLLRGAPPRKARVQLDACTGCTRCYKDCPYDAIVMVPRSDGGRFKLEAVVNPARCVGCGICVGACDSGGIILGDQPVGVLASAVTNRLAEARATSAGHAPVVVYTCRLMASLERDLDERGMLATVEPRPGFPGPRASVGDLEPRHGSPGPRASVGDLEPRHGSPGPRASVGGMGGFDSPPMTIVVMGLPCVGLLHPDLVRQALAAGARGVYIAGCVPQDCQFREGSTWLAERLTGERLPKLRDVPPGHVRVGWYAAVERGRFLRDLDEFLRSLG